MFCKLIAFPFNALWALLLSIIVRKKYKGWIFYKKLAAAGKPKMPSEDPMEDVDYNKLFLNAKYNNMCIMTE